MNRSTPLKRTGFTSKPERVRSEGPTAEREVKQPKQPKEPKERECICGNKFIPRRMEHVVCSPRCLIAKKKADAKAERESFKARKQAMKSVKKLKAEAQDAFNDFIRTRDADLPCVSCSTTNPPMQPGGQWDAGHFLSRGAYPELAFNEDNCHKQCKSCNAGSGKFAHKARTVSAAYEEELLRRIGPERLAALKGPHQVTPLDRQALIDLRATYKAKLKEIKAKEVGQ